MVPTMNDDWQWRVALAASTVASLGWVAGLLAVGYTVFLAVSGGDVAVPSAVALFGVAIGVTFSMVENRLSGRSVFADT